MEIRQAGSTHRCLFPIDLDRGGSTSVPGGRRLLRSIRSNEVCTGRWQTGWTCGTAAAAGSIRAAAGNVTTHPISGHQSPSSPRLDGGRSRRSLRPSVHRRNPAGPSTRMSTHLLSTHLLAASGSRRPSSSGTGQSTHGRRTRVVFGEATMTGNAWWRLIGPHTEVTASTDAGLASSTLLSKGLPLHVVGFRLKENWVGLFCSC